MSGVYMTKTEAPLNHTHPDYIKYNQTYFLVYSIPLKKKKLVIIHGVGHDAQLTTLVSKCAVWTTCPLNKL